MYLSVMKRYRQFQPIAISDFETDRWEHPAHNHNHYELIYIKKGNGKHYIHDCANDYSQGTLYLLGPEDDHYFEIEKCTRFVYIKFTDPYIYAASIGSASHLQNLEYLIKSRDTHLSGFALKPGDLHTVDKIIDVIVSLKDEIFSNEELLWLQILSIASIMQRNMPELKNTGGQSKDMQAMFCYIHKYIYTPDKLKATLMAAHFNISTDYIGPYFKRNAGITLRDYIKLYRKSVVEQRMASGRYSLKEIAAEFGLTDESHVAKVLK